MNVFSCAQMIFSAHMTGWPCIRTWPRYSGVHKAVITPPR